MKNCSVFKFNSLELLINLLILVFSVSEYIDIIVNIGKRFDISDIIIPDLTFVGSLL